MLVLEAGEKCPFTESCRHYTYCHGARSDRQFRYDCDMVQRGQLNDSGSRNPFDQTGKMKVILE